MTDKRINYKLSEDSINTINLKFLCVFYGDLQNMHDFLSSCEFKVEEDELCITNYSLDEMRERLENILKEAKKKEEEQEENEKGENA